MKPHYLGHRKRLRDKYLKNGIESFKDYEIIELLLTFVIPVKDTKPIAKALLKKYGSIKEIFYRINEEKIFKDIKGCGDKTYIFFKLINDIFHIINKEKLVSRRKIKSFNDVVEYCKNSMWNLAHEEFRVILLNSSNEILSFITLQKGIVNETYIYFRQLIKVILEYNATAIILVHNHPGGNIFPSQEDIILTKKIKELLDSVGVTLHDHIIISGENSLSMKNEKLI